MSPRLPRHLAGDDLTVALQRLGYSVTRQTGSHMRLTTMVHGEHHLTVPNHHHLRTGTLSSILTEVERHHRLSRTDLLITLFDA